MIDIRTLVDPRSRCFGGNGIEDFIKSNPSSFVKCHYMRFFLSTVPWPDCRISRVFLLP